MDKVVVYAGTKNVYPHMYTCLKSLLTHTPVDRVYFLIEDDEFPEPLPANVIIKNMKDQTIFPPGSANIKSVYSYMDLLRCALATVLEDEQRVLWLDTDTIVGEDISELLTLDMDGYYYAAAREPHRSRDVFLYTNSGVTLCNLDLIRKVGLEKDMIYCLNTRKFNWPGQDVMNLFAQGHIREIGGEYNATEWTLPCTRPKIIHFAGEGASEFTGKWIYKMYEHMPMPGL